MFDPRLCFAQLDSFRAALSRARDAMTLAPSSRNAGVLQVGSAAQLGWTWLLARVRSCSIFSRTCRGRGPRDPSFQTVVLRGSLEYVLCLSVQVAAAKSLVSNAGAVYAGNLPDRVLAWRAVAVLLWAPRAPGAQHTMASVKRYPI